MWAQGIGRYPDGQAGYYWQQIQAQAQMQDWDFRRTLWPHLPPSVRALVPAPDDPAAAIRDPDAWWQAEIQKYPAGSVKARFLIAGWVASRARRGLTPDPAALAVLGEVPRADA